MHGVDSLDFKAKERRQVTVGVVGGGSKTVQIIGSTSSDDLQIQNRKIQQAL